MCSDRALPELDFTFLQSSLVWPRPILTPDNSHLFLGHPLNTQRSVKWVHSHLGTMQKARVLLKISHPAIISYAFWKERKCVTPEGTMALNTNIKGAQQRKHIMYPVLLQWLYKDFHFTIKGSCSLSCSTWWAPLFRCGFIDIKKSPRPSCQTTRHFKGGLWLLCRLIDRERLQVSICCRTSCRLPDWWKSEDVLALAFSYFTIL